MTQNENMFTVNISKYGDSVGPREIGKEIRERAIAHLKEGKKILFSFRGVHLISSGFSDELFGLLFAEIGEDKFKNEIKINEFDNDNDKNIIIAAIIRALEYRKKLQK